MGCGVEESFYYGFNDYIGSKIEYTAWDVDDAAPEGRGFCVGGRIEDKDGEYRHIVMYYSYPVDLSFHSVAPAKYATFSFDGKEAYGINTINCKDNQRKTTGWTVVGTTASFINENTVGKLAEYERGSRVFVMTDTEFKLYKITTGTNSNGLFHCGWRVCSNLVKTTTSHPDSYGYWGFRNRFLTSNANTIVMAWDNANNWSDDIFKETYLVVLNIDGTFRAGISEDHIGGAIVNEAQRLNTENDCDNGSKQIVKIMTQVVMMQ